MRMLSKNGILRLILFAAPVIALAAAALFLTLGPGSGERARADAPHPGLDFAIGVDFNADGTNDCGSGVPSAVGDGAPDAVAADVSSTTCTVPAVGTTLQVNVYLMNAGGATYSGAASQVYFTGLTSQGRGTSLWTCHLFDAPANSTTYENKGSAIGFAPPCNVSQTNLGLMNRFMFTCTASGTLRLGYGIGETGLTDDALVEHREAGPDELTVNCGGGGGGPTDTPVPPTNTPVAPTDTPTGPTNTPTNTATTGPTNTPTNTVPPTATRTATPTRESQLGDVNGDGVVDAEDALWILWDEAGIDNVPLPEKADVNQDGRVNSIDALWILWMVGGDV